MKTQFSHRRNVHGTRALTWQIGAFGAVFLIILLLVVIRLALPTVFLALATPLWEGGSSLDAGAGSVFSNFSDKATLVKENTALAEEVTTLQNENAVLTTRSQDLTQLLGGQVSMSGDDGSGEGSAGASILAGVLARPPVAAYDTLVVAAGKSAGVTAGAEAFAKGGVPIGTVKTVAANSSTIELFSNGGRSTDGWVGTDRTPVTLIGTGGGTFSATLPKDADITVGDSVYVPGPGALPIGTVIGIGADPSSPTVVLHIQPSVNMFSITWVEIAPSAS